MNAKEKYNHQIELREIEMEWLDKHHKYLSRYLDVARKEVIKYQKLKNKNFDKTHELRKEIEVIMEKEKKCV